MEVYILDSLYRRIDLIDDYISLVWTERCREVGDFQMTVLATLQNRNRFVSGTNLAMSESKYVMMLQTVEDTTDTEGRLVLKVSGPSIEKILDDRYVIPDLSIDPMAKVSYTNDPVTIMETIFHDVCVAGDPDDVIPNVVESNDIYPTDTVDDPIDTITFETDPVSVLTAEKTIAEAYSLGFRMCLDRTTNQFYWDVYTGSDRTTHQSILPAVVFAPNLQNLQNTTELKSNALYKNCALVVCPTGHALVFPPILDPAEVTGFDRHMIFVKIDDITETDPDLLNALLVRRGRDELAKYPLIHAFDGEINTASYVYGRDYNLGDLVEMRNTDGAANIMQVTEQIFASDEQGKRSYPTLTVNKFITPGSWDAWPLDDFWDDHDLDDTAWDELP